MAKNWYDDTLINPWRARNSAGMVVLTNDPSREDEIQREVVIKMALRLLLENAPAAMGGANVPVSVDYYMMDVKTPVLATLAKYSLYIDLDELKELAKDKKASELMRKGASGYYKLFTEGKLNIYIRAVQITKNGPRVKAFNLLEFLKKGRLPEPIPMTLEGTRANPKLVETTEVDKIGFVPVDVVSRILMVMYHYGLDPSTKQPINSAILTFIRGVKVRENDINERASPITLLKAVTKDPAVLRRGSGLILTVPSLGLIPQDLRDNMISVDKRLPTREEIKALLENTVKMLKKRGLIPKNSKVTDELVESSVGLTLDQIKGTLFESAYIYGDIKIEAFRDKKIRILGNKGVHYVEPKITLEHVGGMKILKEATERKLILPIKKPELLEKAGLASPRGFIMAGIGGTGKTWFVNALAGSLGKPVIHLRASDFMSKYLGESEQRLDAILNIANEMGAILFIDEIDALGMSRENAGLSESATSRRIVNILMEFLGRADRRAIVIGATNRLVDMDPDFLRSGRFDRIFLVNPPDHEGRAEILKIHALKLHPPKELKFEEGVFKKVAEKTHLWTGAELEALVNEAKWMAILHKDKVVTLKHFEEAMKYVNINMKGRKEAMQAQINYLENMKQGVVEFSTVKEAKQMLSQGYTGAMKTQEEILPGAGAPEEEEEEEEYVGGEPLKEVDIPEPEEDYNEPEL